MTPLRPGRRPSPPSRASLALQSLPPRYPVLPIALHPSAVFLSSAVSSALAGASPVSVCVLPVRPHPSLSERAMKIGAPATLKRGVHALPHPTLSGEPPRLALDPRSGAQSASAPMPRIRACGLHRASSSGISSLDTPEPPTALLALSYSWHGHLWERLGLTARAKTNSSPSRPVISVRPANPVSHRHFFDLTVYPRSGSYVVPWVNHWVTRYTLCGDCLALTRLTVVSGLFSVVMIGT